MKIIGIISEYNPFHNGHLYQIEKARENGATHIVVVMSGNYVQRGDVAIFSKWARAKACISCGVDLVVELPTPLAMSPAKDFATGAMSILDRLLIDSLCFGSESANKDMLFSTANACLEVDKSPLMLEFLLKGFSYPKARQICLERLFSKREALYLSNANDVLGIEYINAIKLLKRNIDIMPIKREHVLHDSSNIHSNIASASLIRDKILNEGINSIKNYVPDNAFDIYLEQINNHLAPCNIKNLERAILYKIKTSDKEYINSISDVVEGLGNRIIDMGNKATSFEELISLCSTKRYTNARIRRIIMNTFLDIKKNQFPKTAEYVRVLAMNQKGIEVLRKAKAVDDAILISPKFANIIKGDYSQAIFENKATNLYFMSSPEVAAQNQEFSSQATVLTE